MAIRQCPVHSAEDGVGDGFAIQSADLRACGVERVARRENVDESCKRIAGDTGRELVGWCLDQSREERLVRVPAVQRDEEMGAVTHDRTAEATTPLHGGKLSLTSRACLKVGLRCEIAVAI